MPKCKRRVRVGLVAAVTAAGVFAATAVAATIDGDDGPNRLVGTRDADVIQAFGGNDRVLALAGDDQVSSGRQRPGPRGRERRVARRAGDDRLRGGAATTPPTARRAGTGSSAGRATTRCMAAAGTTASSAGSATTR